MSISLLIMAAGLGSRYGGDKQIDGLGPHGEILMEYTIHDALAAGFDRVVFVIRKSMEERFRALVGDRIGQKCEVRYAFQEADSLPEGFVPPADRVKPYGTVHAVLCARGCIDGPFAVVNADDYYGKDAFVCIADTLRGMDGKAACMVAYDLGNTLSDHGTVTRGVCTTDASGCLVSVTETYKLGWDEQGAIRDFAPAEPSAPYAPDTPVSMNFWGLTPWFFGQAAAHLDAFLRDPATDPLKGEYVLPTLIDTLMKEEDLPVRVLRTHAKWFGVTYREDKPLVQEALRRLHEAGEYPDRL
ncbi:MAG: nucleotidyltransferase [Clostridia bacterium]|nr:nucleotidyltransferase [Clostridia bacterium]